MSSVFNVRLDHASPVPLYKQLSDGIAHLIERRILSPGTKLPATRELAGQLGLNRSTISAAYTALEQLRLIEGQVGRGSFVAVPELTPDGFDVAHSPSAEISFASSRPADSDFPLEEFRRLAKEVVDGPDALRILQLGSARGYAPLRRYLLNEALRSGEAHANDDLLVTNGCQQALDLIARVFAGPGTSIAVEDPVYHGMLRAFARTGADLYPVPVDGFGMDLAALEQMVQRHRPALVAVTPTFQNPTGTTLPLERRQRILALSERFGFTLIEVDIYSALRYEGETLPTLKQLQPAGRTLLLRSYSKVSFPGLRVGWVLGDRQAIAQLAEAKEASDLHSDQLSQAVLLRFAQSGELDRHLSRTLRTGAARLHAALAGCQSFLPAGARWTRPEGGFSLWVELPAPLSAETLLSRAQSRGVNFLPGRHFCVRDGHPRGLRISFGALAPEHITQGLRILGELATAELATLHSACDNQPAAALV